LAQVLGLEAIGPEIVSKEDSCTSAMILSTGAPLARASSEVYPPRQADTTAMFLSTPAPSQAANTAACSQRGLWPQSKGTATDTAAALSDRRAPSTHRRDGSLLSTPAPPRAADTAACSQPGLWSPPKGTATDTAAALSDRRAPSTHRRDGSLLSTPAPPPAADTAACSLRGSWSPPKSIDEDTTDSGSTAADGETSCADTEELQSGPRSPEVDCWETDKTWTAATVAKDSPMKVALPDDSKQFASSLNFGLPAKKKPLFVSATGALRLDMQAPLKKRPSPFLLENPPSVVQ